MSEYLVTKREKCYCTTVIIDGTYYYNQPANKDCSECQGRGYTDVLIPLSEALKNIT